MTMYYQSVHENLWYDVFFPIIQLISRSPNEVYEILSLTGHLMPPLPKDGESSLGRPDYLFQDIIQCLMISWLDIILVGENNIC